MRDVGVERWGASGMAALIPISGDFDIRLQFDELALAKVGNGGKSTLMLDAYPASQPQTIVNSMLGLDSSGIIQAEGYARVRMPDGSLWYNGTERLEVTSATALRIVRQGKRFFMLARPQGESLDRIVSMSEHSVAPLFRLQVLLHGGGAGDESSVRLKKLEIHAERF